MSLLGHHTGRLNGKMSELIKSKNIKRSGYLYSSIPTNNMCSNIGLVFCKTVYEKEQEMNVTLV